MNCKFCNAELEAGATKCPACGTEVEQENKLSAGKIALLAVLAVAAVAVVVALIMGGLNSTQEPLNATEAPTAGTEESVAETTEATIPADGNPDDVTCKGSYTVTDEEVLAAQSTVVATAGNSELTNGELQVYYWMQFYDFLDMYSSYASMLGLNVYQSLDTQISLDGSLTWQQYFLDSGLSTWHSYEALCLEAEANGFVMDAEYRDYLDALPATLNDTAVSSGFENAQEMLQADMGPGATLESYLQFLENYYKGYLYYSECLESIELTDDEVAAYYDEHVADYEANGLTKDTRFIDVRHILLTPEGGTTNEDGTVSYSEEEWEACRVAAQAVLDEYLAGELTEERFAELAGQYSVDTGSNANGGLYTDVYEGQMVEPFENWCFDASRTYGETGLVQTTYGYHVMFFVESKAAWYETAWSDLIAERGEQVVDNAMAAHPLTVDYSAIALGNVDFAAAE